MPERPNILKLLGSAAVALLLVLPLWRAAALRPAPEKAAASVAPPATDFHARDRTELPPATGPGCSDCHAATPHSKKRVVRAFLNAHVADLDCSVCHFKGAAVFKRFDSSGREVASGGDVHAARRDGAGHAPVDWRAHDANLARSGPSCRECHRRGGGLLSVPGLYDEYRKRLLEDLDVLARSGGAL